MKINIRLYLKVFFPKEEIIKLDEGRLLGD
jgi:hypothetical protein